MRFLSSTSSGDGIAAFTDAVSDFTQAIERFNEWVQELLAGLDAAMQTALSVIFAGAIVVGAVQCFVGYRCFRVVLGLVGFLLGALLGGAGGYLASGANPLVGVFAGLVFGVLGFFGMRLFYLAGVFLTGAVFGLLLGLLLAFAFRMPPEPALVFLLAIVGGVVALFLQKLLIILGTACAGSGKIVSGVAFFATMAGGAGGGADVSLNAAAGVGWLVLAIAGIWVQFQDKMFSRGGPLGESSAEFPESERKEALTGEPLALEGRARERDRPFPERMEGRGDSGSEVPERGLVDRGGHAGTWQSDKKRDPREASPRGGERGPARLRADRSEEAVAPRRGDPEGTRLSRTLMRTAHRLGEGARQVLQPEEPTPMWLEGKDPEGRRYFLEFDERTFREWHGRLYLGRMRVLCQLVLSQDSVSRRHAKLSLRDGRIWIEDCNSGNGTWVNGRELELGSSARLRSGDRIELGEVELILRAPRPLLA